MTNLKRVLIMAGGTGGHVFPGLAVAKYLQDHDVVVDWLGTEHGLESKLVPEANIPLHFITIAGLRGKGLKALMLAPFKIVKACWQAKKIISKVNPDVVIGMGGFASGPGGMASYLMRRPLVIHEQNAKAGMTNKLLAKLSKRVLTAFPGAFPAGKSVSIIGNPVRAEIASLPHPQSRFDGREGPLRLLVVGGSLGAQALNEVIPRAVAKLHHDKRPVIRHQAGARNSDQARNLYKNKNVDAEVTAFIEDMAESYAWADIVICRAGALTVSELCAAGLGAVFVPYPFAVDDHQTKNAMFMVNSGAARCIQQSALTDGALAAIVSEFADRKKCLKMAEAAYALREPRATESVFNVCEEICH